MCKNEDNIYEIVRYTKKDIEKAGKVLSNEYNDILSVKDSLDVIDNWRAAHAFPLDNIANILKEAISSNENFLFAQRIKRLESIVGKLRRLRTTNLYRMQDLGGCRIIVPSIDNMTPTISKIKEILIKNNHTIVREKDYLKEPRIESGYRSYHIVVKFNCPLTCYDGMLIEIQIRTKLQHYWATAVEIIDSNSLLAFLLDNKSEDSNKAIERINEYSLKGGSGNKNDRYFFKLISGLFSIHENTNVVAGVPNDYTSLIKEIYEVDSKIKLRERLASYRTAINFTGDYPQKADYFLLVTNFREHSIQTIGFLKEDIEDAIDMYFSKEKERETHKLDVVLVSCQNFANIRECYPNYFLDTSHFLSTIKNLCLIYPEKSSLKLKIESLGERLSQYFTITKFAPNLERDNNFTEDGIGIPNSDVILCIPWNVTLENSYLRFSGINLDYNKLNIKDDLKAQIINGPAIIVLSTGASYYVDKKSWSFFSEVDSILIQCKEGVDSNMLLVLIAWLKSNICIWSLLWNNHSNSIVKNDIYLDFKIPLLDKHDYEVVISCTNELLGMEQTFVETYNNTYTEDDARFDLIDSFNNSTLRVLKQIELSFKNYFSISDNDYDILIKELKNSGCFTYFE